MTDIAHYQLSKQDVTAIRQCDRLVVGLNNPGQPGPRVEAIKEFRVTDKNPFAHEETHRIPCLVYAHGGGTQDQRDSAQCFELIWTYSQRMVSRCPATSALALLRVGDVVRFEFYADAHSNDYMARAGLHGDALYLHIRRGDKEVGLFEIGSSHCPDNSARMIKGIPSSEHFRKVASGQEAA